jgi:hypothetical protein
MQYRFNKEKSIFVLQEALFDSIKGAVGSAVGNVASSAMNKLSSVSAERNLKVFLQAISNYDDNFKQKANEIINSAKEDTTEANLLENCKKFIELLVSVNTGDKQRYLSKVLQKMNSSELPQKFKGLYLDGLDGFSAFLLDFINQNKLNVMLNFFGIEVVESSKDKNLLVKAEKENLIAILATSIKQSNILKFLNQPDFTELIKNNFTQFLNSLEIDSSKDDSIVDVLQKISDSIAQVKNSFSQPIHKNGKTLSRFLIGKQILLTYITQIFEEIEQKQSTSFPNTLRKCQEVKTSGVLTATDEMNQMYNQLKQAHEATAPSDLTERKLLKEYREEINNLLLPTMQKQLKFDTLPAINFIEDEQNAKDMFGKTAYYNPNTSEITVFITGRHPKDIMRSVAHEVIHHSQNLRGEFDNIFDLGVEGYAQSNNHLRNLEGEAFLFGNVLFRDWEDELKKQRKSNTMINEKVLRAKIRALISEMTGLQNADEAKNEPAHEYDEGCNCDSCKKESVILKNKGLAESTKKVIDAEKQVMPLNEWRRMELNSLLLNRFGIVSPEVLGEKKKNAYEKDVEDADNDGSTEDKVPAFLKKGSAKKPAKKGKVPPQFLKKEKKDESK